MSVRRLKSTWEDLGRVDPLWAVLTDPGRRHGGWDADEFLDTGAKPIAWVRGLLRSSSMSFGDRVLDFGCGAGRLANALAAHAREVVGVDIAQSMVDEADRINRYPGRVSFTAYDGHVLPFADESFDSAVSLISIQHAPPAVQLTCLLELQRVVRTGGVLVLQIPSRPAKPDPLPAEAMRARIELLSVPTPVGTGQVAPVRAAITNTSRHTWPAGQLIRLGNHWHRDGTPVRWNDGRADLPRDLAPGGEIELELPVTAPDAPGRYDLELDLVQEAVSWWADAGNRPVRAAVDVVPDEVAVPARGPRQEIEPRPAPRGRDDCGMAMYGMDPRLVRLAFAHCGSSVVHTVADTMAGDEWESVTYVVRRGSV